MGAESAPADQYWQFAAFWVSFVLRCRRYFLMPMSMYLPSPFKNTMNLLVPVSLIAINKPTNSPASSLTKVESSGTKA